MYSGGTRSPVGHAAGAHGRTGALAKIFGGGRGERRRAGQKGLADRAEGQNQRLLHTASTRPQFYIPRHYLYNTTRARLRTLITCCLPPLSLSLSVSGLCASASAARVPSSVPFLRWTCPTAPRRRHPRRCRRRPGRASGPAPRRACWPAGCSSSSPPASSRPVRCSSPRSIR